MDEIERVKFLPPDDSSMLDWYRGAFSGGFIALHPFFTVQGLDPKFCEHGTLVLNRSARPDHVGLIEWMDSLAEERQIGKEIPAISMADIAKQFGRKIGWREICHQVGLPDHCALDRALRSHIQGLKKEIEDQDSAKRLTSYCNRHSIFLPTEGTFQPTMESSLVHLLQKAGLSDVIVGDEFGQQEKKIPLVSLLQEIAWESRDDFPNWGARRLMAPDRSLLVWVHWDSFYTAVFGTSERLCNLQLSNKLEGFWCSSESTSYWLMQDAIPLVQ